VRTLIVSDLHVGDRAGNDVLRRDGVAQALVKALEGVDRLVLLGDTLELRNRPVGAVLADAEPIFRLLGGALAGKAVVIVAGNHDHVLAEHWLSRHDTPLGLEHRFTPEQASDLAMALAAALGKAHVELAYPGIWLREDVYATHGHYLDVHMTVPTFERIAIAASGRVALDRSHRWNDVHSPADYEGLVAPIYAWMYVAAQSGRPGQATGGGAAIRAWKTLRSGRTGGLRAQAFKAGFPLAVRALNAAGLGPLQRELSTTTLRSAGLRAMGEVVERLRIADGRVGAWQQGAPDVACHVIFGHTHRAGMIEGDEPAAWLTPNRVQLHNAGAWVYSETFVGAGDPRSPYWPGTALLVEDGAPPRLLRLLADHTPAQLRASRVRP
jgi:UDP-2,3-diacylglucosamine pyrophosphatase LpxH